MQHEPNKENFALVYQKLRARPVKAQALPVIDISGLRSPELADRETVGEALRAACADKGFLYVIGHGIPQNLREAVIRESVSFFELPAGEKSKIHLKLSACNRGYEPLQAQSLDANAPPDLKEGFYIGRHRMADDPMVVAGKFGHGPNQWPDTLPNFQQVMEVYYSKMVDLGRLMMRGIALSLGLAENHFAPFCQNEVATLRLLHYPPQPANPDPGEMGCGAHTDFGTLTFLMQDTCGGLQVKDERDGWIHAEPLPESYVVNLGDLMTRWTNDTYRSTLHRVVNMSGRERYSVPFFYMGNPDYPVRCISTCLEDGVTPTYPETTVDKHFQEMYRATYSGSGLIT